MLKICLVFWKSEPQYAYKHYSYKKKTCKLIAVIARNRVQLPKKFRRVNLKQGNQTSP